MPLTAIIQGGDDAGLDQVSSSETGERWSDFGYIKEGKPVRHSDRLK